MLRPSVSSFGSLAMRAPILALFAIATLSACDATTPIAPDAPYTQAEVDAVLAEWQAGRPSFAEAVAAMKDLFAGDSTAVRKWQGTDESAEMHRVFMASTRPFINLLKTLHAGQREVSAADVVTYHRHVDQLLEEHAIVLDKNPHIVGHMARNALTYALYESTAPLLPDADTRLRYAGLLIESGHVEEWSVLTYHLEQAHATRPAQTAEWARQSLIRLAAREQDYYATMSFAKRFWGWMWQQASAEERESEEAQAQLASMREEAESPWRPEEKYLVVDGRLERVPDVIPVDVAAIRARLTVLL